MPYPAPLTVGLVPNKLTFYDEGSEHGEMASEDAMHDVIAKIVMQRFRDARRHKSQNQVYEGKSTVQLLREADFMMEKRYTASMSDMLCQVFGRVPTNYIGLAASKTRAIIDWKSEIVAGDPGALMQITPTPRPRLPESTLDRIKAEVKDELVKLMEDQGLSGQQLLDVRNGRLHRTVKDWLGKQAKALRDIEQQKVVSEALDGATQVQRAMRDLIIEGDFREAYAGFSTAQIKYGVGIARFPYWQRRVVLADKQDNVGRAGRQWKVVPTFAYVSPWNFFPLADGRDVSSCSAVMEYREWSKAELVNRAYQEGYNKQAILDILEDYSFKSRTWLFPEAVEVRNEQDIAATYWGPEETIAVITHEGTVTGRDLQDHGLTGYDAHELYEVRAEICGGRTIRMKVVNPLQELPRSYATSKFDDMGAGVWNAIGVPGILRATQDRVNILWHCMEHNIEWSTLPPWVVNGEALKNPNEARSIRPGGKYEINDDPMPGRSMDPIRAVKAVSSQYNIIYGMIAQIMRGADAEVGVPDLADMSTFGRGSLGELSARVSQAVRRIRNAAFAEDRSLKPIWRVIFEYVLDENPEIVPSVDLDLNYKGIVGLLAAEQERQGKMQRLGLIERGVQAGVAPPELLKFAYHDLYRDDGVPTEALGMSDPLTDNAVAAAIGQGFPAQQGLGMQQVPQLDGRSGAMGAIPTAVAQPNGGSAVNPMGIG